MDLLQSVRKEGSRGGRADFKWEDVKNDQHRENYLGHSLMAPVGRWQSGKDLSWYAKGDGNTSVEDARKEELRRIKQAEADALNIALGLPVASNNPNITPLGERASESDVKKALAQSGEVEESENQKGIGFGSYSGRRTSNDMAGEVLEGNEDERPQLRDRVAHDRGRDRKRSRSRSRDRHRRNKDYGDDKHRRRRSRSDSRERNRKARSNEQEERRHRIHRSRSRERRRLRSRSRSNVRDNNNYGRREYRERRPRDRYRSRSPVRDRREYRSEKG